MYFAIIKNILKCRYANGSVKNYVLKYLAKRQAKSKKKRKKYLYIEDGRDDLKKT